jgi:hypothetical protein
MFQGGLPGGVVVVLQIQNAVQCNAVRQNQGVGGMGFVYIFCAGESPCLAWPVWQTAFSSHRQLMGP